MKNEKNYQDFLKAKEFIKQKKFEEAYTKLKKVRKKEPDNLVLKYEFAKILIEINNLSRARRIFRSLLNTYNDKFAILELGKLDVIEGNYIEARKNFEFLIGTSKFDYGLLELGKLEVLEGNYDKAKENFETILNIKNSINKGYSIQQLMMLSIKLKEYDEALIYLNKLINFKENYEVKELEKYKFYIEYKLNKIKNYKGIKGYFYNQLISYNEKTALEHIKKHLKNDDKKPIHSVFNSDIDIVSLFYSMKDRIKNLEPVNFGLYDKYTFDMEQVVGNAMNIKTNYLNVTTICNTKNIISIYPILSKDGLKNKQLDNQKVLQLKKVLQ